MKDNKKKIRRIIIISFFAIVAVCAAVLLSPLFRIEQIEISPCGKTTEVALENSFDDLKGANGFMSVIKNTTFRMLDRAFQGRMTKKENKIIFDCPVIRTAEVKFVLPDTLKVSVTERNVSFFADDNGTKLLIDTSGVVVGAYSDETTETVGAPVVTGLNISGYKVGNSIIDSKNKQLLAAINICNAIKNSGKTQNTIDIIDLTNYNDIWMFVSPSLSVKFGAFEDAETKVSLLFAIMENGYDGNSDGVIDFTSGKNPVFKSHEIIKEEAEDTE